MQTFACSGTPVPSLPEIRGKIPIMGPSGGGVVGCRRMTGRFYAVRFDVLHMLIVPRCSANCSFTVIELLHESVRMRRRLCVFVECDVCGNNLCAAMSI